MSARTRAMLLLLFGLVLLRLGASDLLLRFVRAGARPWTVVAGAAVVALAVWTFCSAGGEVEQPKARGRPPRGGHHHASASPLGWLALRTRSPSKCRS